MTITNLLEIWHLTQYFDLGGFQSTLNISCLKYPRVQMDKGLSKTWENFHCSAAAELYSPALHWKTEDLHFCTMIIFIKSQRVKRCCIWCILKIRYQCIQSIFTVFFSKCHASCKVFPWRFLLVKKGQKLASVCLLIQIKV